MKLHEWYINVDYVFLARKNLHSSTWFYTKYQEGLTVIQPCILPDPGLSYSKVHPMFCHLPILKHNENKSFQMVLRYRP